MKDPKIILAIESSCDETSAAIVQNTPEGVKILSNIVASSADLQAKYGGVVPEQAARAQLESVIPVIKEALKEAQISQEQIDAIAVTQGPGLIGSLLIGVETAKVLSLVWQKPLVPVNHLLGHFYANWINTGRSEDQKIRRSERSEVPEFPCLGLLVSGGHTDLVLFENHGKYKYLGGTRDDAAGEAFDKTARLLGLPYPGGPIISKLAQTGNPKAFQLPRPMIDSKDFDFSFSGLKTAVYNLVQKIRIPEDQNIRNPILRFSDIPISPKLSDLCASIEEAIVDVIVKKTVAAAQKYNIEQIIVAGGVAANQRLSEKLTKSAKIGVARAQIFIPPPKLCTDNAAYIGAAAFFNYRSEDPLKIQANPNLSLDNHTLQP